MNDPLAIKAPLPLLELRDVQRSYLQGTVKLDVLNNASLSAVSYTHLTLPTKA